MEGRIKDEEIRIQGKTVNLQEVKVTNERRLKERKKIIKKDKNK
jgi:hypothetical protein